MHVSASHPSCLSPARTGQRPRPKPPVRPYDLPASVHREVHSKSRRIVRVLGLPRDQVDDVAGELNLGLAAALRRFDASRGTLRSFSSAVLAQQYMAVIKRARAQQAKHRAVSLHSLDDEHQPAAAARPATLPHDWTRDEVRAALKLLPPDDLIFARLVANLPIRAVAKAIGCHHGTVVRRKQRLRRQIRAAISQIRENARTTRRARAEMY